MLISFKCWISRAFQKLRQQAAKLLVSWSCHGHGSLQPQLLKRRRAR